MVSCRKREWEAVEASSEHLAQKSVRERIKVHQRRTSSRIKDRRINESEKIKNQLPNNPSIYLPANLRWHCPLPSMVRS